jgi:hypothetical protein
MAYGGSKLWVNSAVDDLTTSPNLGWSITSSSATWGCNRWGDYIAIRPAYGQKGSTFTASGYGADKTSTGYSYDTHFAAFTVNP